MIVSLRAGRVVDIGVARLLEHSAFDPEFDEKPLCGPRFGFSEPLPVLNPKI
jgi:hypothetical protein